MNRGRTVSIDGDPSVGEWLCNMSNRTCSDPTFEMAVNGESYELGDCLTQWAVEQARSEPRHKVKRTKDGKVKLVA